MQGSIDRDDGFQAVNRIAEQKRQAGPKKVKPGWELHV
jgi:hypothetical protein